MSLALAALFSCCYTAHNRGMSVEIQTMSVNSIIREGS